MACDLIFVLARSFKEVTFRANGQPNEKDVSAAARNYKLRGYAKHVHRHIELLVPRRNLAASYKVEVIRQSVEDLFAKYKDKLMEDVDLPLEVRDMKIGENPFDDDNESTETESTLFADLKEASAAYAELEANTPVAELDASKSMVELPAENERPISELSAESKVSELEDISSARKRYELSS